MIGYSEPIYVVTPMIVGNQQAQEMIAHFFEAVQKGETVFPFLLLNGRKYLGKTIMIETTLKQFLGEFFSTDYLPLYDFSSQLGKEHSVKVEVSRDQEMLEIDGKSYANIGMRALTQRLALAPLGKRKVVYLENIDRMTSAAANALLKTLEEPLPGRLIIASVAQAETLLDTIRSRALIINFIPLPPQELQQQLEQAYPQAGKQDREFAGAFSLGARGLATRLLEDEEIALRGEQFSATRDRFVSPGRIDEQRARLAWFTQQGQLDALLDALLYGWWNDPKRHVLTERLVRAKQLFETNVGQEHILFRLCM